MTVWRRTRLKYLASGKAGTWGSEPGEADADVYCVRAADFDRDRFRVSPELLPLRSVDAAVFRELALRPGDLVLEKSGGGADRPVGGSVLFDLDIPAMCSNFATRLRPLAETDPRFLTYLMAAAYFCGVTASLAKQTTGIANLDVGAYMATSWRVPDAAAQRAIADYLDAETARIDALVGRRRQTIKLLDERRLTVVASMTGVLDVAGDGRMLSRLKFAVGRPTSGNRDHAFTSDDSGIPCLRGLNIKPGWVDQRDLMRISEADHRRHDGTILRSGDVVIVRSGNAGTAAVVPPQLDGANCVDLVIIRQTPNVSPKYLEYLLNSHQARSQAEANVFGATLTHFNAVDVAELNLFIPSAEEQMMIVARLDQITARIDEARTAIERQIDLVLERRQALITAAVTGQLEIPGAAA